MPGLSSEKHKRCGVMMSKSQGADLMNQINSGELVTRSSEVAEEVKEKVSEALDEIITSGARIRPLFLDSKRIGWVRPLFYAERKVLDRLSVSPTERTYLMLKHCTSLSDSALNNLDGREIQQVLKIIGKMNLADYSLYPFIQAFTSTQTSYNLWYIRDNALLCRKTLELPTGESLKVMAVNDHIKLWVSLSEMRFNSIQKLEQALALSAIVKAQIGQKAERYVQDLSRVLNSFKTDSLDPWMDTVDFVKVDKKINYNDGFGHSHEDDSVSGLLREIKGMMEGDKHEQLMASFYNHQISEAKAQQAEVSRLIEERQKQLESMEDETLVVLTDAEVNKRVLEIKEKQGVTRVQSMSSSELSSQDVDDTPTNPNLRIAKYFEKEE